MQKQYALPENFKNNLADVALVPVGALTELSGYHIFSDYCIGAENKVRTVTLMSQVPLNEITDIALDYQSKTSVRLAKLLAEKYWKIKPEFRQASKGYEKQITDTSAAVIIGDRVFEHENNVKYIFDLSEEWYNWKKLPFVFAVWIARNNVPKEVLQQINKALEYGVENINPSIDEFFNQEVSSMNKNTITKYLHQNIKYNFNETMQQSIRIFLKEQEELSATTPCQAVADL